MTKILTIQEANEKFELFQLYSDIIETYGDHLENPNLISDIYDLVDEHEDKYEFQPDKYGDYSESFERNLIEALHSIVEENEELEFSGDEIPTDVEFFELGSDHFERDRDNVAVDLNDDDEFNE